MNSITKVKNYFTNYFTNYLANYLAPLIVAAGCGAAPASPSASDFNLAEIRIGNEAGREAYLNVSSGDTVTLTFSARVAVESIAANIILKQAEKTIPIAVNHDGNPVLKISLSSLQPYTGYTLTVNTGLKSESGAAMLAEKSLSVATGDDVPDKFERISDEALLDLVQRQTFRYFWDFGHPVSGLARERTSSGDMVTSGGSGFGLMALLAGIERGFITREEGLTRFTKIVDFLQSKAETFHGAFPHWLNGSTGKAQFFSPDDNGGDLVETAYLIQGLLAVKEYFKAGASAQEVSLCSAIRTIWENVEWDWYRQNGQNALFWHWSADKGWKMNMRITGWNECLIVYVLAASSPTHSIPKAVYDEGWARSGAIRNGSSYHSVRLPLGEDRGGPLFFAHYSFLGLNPHKVSDQYADYWEQNVAHATINYRHCVANPKGYAGYGAGSWGLTASDIPNGYTASSPTNDVGTIAPTAALASFPYTPDESMAALHFFYYKLGDKLWTQYGFRDAFNLSKSWFAADHLAIDQGPIVVMIENYRTGLLWNLFMAIPEIRKGLEELEFTVRD
ncbi:MAG: Ig-like domain-containing protein [Prevotellaceae bacterium]|nr:Ig-like domain-containing protein [Prevotellaceae bacterium]